MRFDYRKEYSKIFGEIYRPIAELYLIKGKVRIRKSFYVDSGADISLIPKSVGDLLGLVYEKSSSCRSNWCL